MSFLSTVDLYGRKRLQVVPPEDGKPVPPFLTASRSSSPTMQEALANLEREVISHPQEQPMTDTGYEATPLEGIAMLVPRLSHREFKKWVADMLGIDMTNLTDEDRKRIWEACDRVEIWSEKNGGAQ